MFSLYIQYGFLVQNKITSGNRKNAAVKNGEMSGQR